MSKEQVKNIATSLNETKPDQMGQINQAIYILGAEKIQTLFEETLKVEADGGMMTSNGNAKNAESGSETLVSSIVEGTTRAAMTQHHISETETTSNDLNVRKRDAARGHRSSFQSA